MKNFLWAKDHQYVFNSQTRHILLDNHIVFLSSNFQFNTLSAEGNPKLAANQVDFHTKQRAEKDAQVQPA